jgi:alpha-glucosidase
MKKQLTLLICLTTLLTIILGCSTNKRKVVLTSPNQKLIANVYIKNNQLKYCLKYNGNSLIKDSDLGIEVDNIEFGKNVNMISVIENKVVDNYQLIHKTNSISYEANTCEITLQDIESNQNFQIECQLSNGGFAFRYKLKNKGKTKINKEKTIFTLSDNSKLWFFERNNKRWKLISYAGEWISAGISKMEKISSSGPIQGLPLMVDLANLGYMFISEVANYNYSGLRLKAIGNNSFEANYINQKGFEFEGDVVTPWRIVAYEENLNDLVNSTIVTDLAPNPDSELYADLSYIKPGKCVWSWITVGVGSPKEEMKNIDNAKKLNFEYSLVDDGWEAWNDKWKSITEVCQYGKKNGVGVFIWKDSRLIDKPDNDYQQMREWLDKAQKTHTVGVKVDFMEGDTKKNIDFEIRLLKECAKRKLMVNFHGCTKPTGEVRTFPNEVTREGIRGLELNAMGEGSIPAYHNAALPFTRFVVGHGDYTPLSFTMPGETTWAHQLATLVCFSSPVNALCEESNFLLTNPLTKPALNFIKSCPTIWDETRVLKESKIGEIAVLARRKGSSWYIGILNAGSEQDYQLDLDFLSESKYKLIELKDDLKANLVDIRGMNNKKYLDHNYNSTPIPFKREEKLVDNKMQVNIKLAKNGGYVAIIK